jgi:hypothetical protein
MVQSIRPLMIIPERSLDLTKYVIFLGYYTFYNSNRRLYHHP